MTSYTQHTSILTPVDRKLAKHRTASRPPYSLSASDDCSPRSGFLPLPCSLCFVLRNRKKANQDLVSYSFVLRAVRRFAAKTRDLPVEPG